MDRTEWPWSWEEEAEWKAELEARDYDFLEELIDSAVEDGITGPRDVFELPQQEEPAEAGTLENYAVTA